MPCSRRTSVPLAISASRSLLAVASLCDRLTPPPASPPARRDRRLSRKTGRAGAPLGEIPGGGGCWLRHAAMPGPGWAARRETSRPGDLRLAAGVFGHGHRDAVQRFSYRSKEHTSELQSLRHLV